MTERQVELIMNLIREKLEDFFTEGLADRVAAEISEAINDNSVLLAELGENGGASGMDDEDFPDLDTETEEKECN